MRDAARHDAAVTGPDYAAAPATRRRKRAPPIPAAGRAGHLAARQAVPARLVPAWRVIPSRSWEVLRAGTLASANEVQLAEPGIQNGLICVQPFLESARV